MIDQGTQAEREDGGEEGERKREKERERVITHILYCINSENYFSFGGSCVKTSSAAPPHWPLCRALSNASSSMIPPRATLITLTPFLHLANTASFKRPYIIYKIYIILLRRN